MSEYWTQVILGDATGDSSIRVGDGGASGAGRSVLADRGQRGVPRIAPSPPASAADVPSSRCGGTTPDLPLEPISSAKEPSLPAI